MPPGAWADGADLYYSASLNAVFVDDTQSGMQSNLPEFPPPGDDWGGDGDTNWVYQSQSHQIPSFPDSTNLYIAILSASAVPSDLASLALVNTRSNLVYMIQTSTNLSYANWDDEGVVIGGSGTNTPFATFIGDRTNQLFYRAYLLSTNPVGAIVTLASGANCIASVNHEGTNTYSAFLGSLVGFSPPIYSLNLGYSGEDWCGSVYQDTSVHWSNPDPLNGNPHFQNASAYAHLTNGNVASIVLSGGTLATLTNLFLSYNPISSLEVSGAPALVEIEAYGCTNLEYVNVTGCPNLFRACLERCAIQGVLDFTGDRNLTDIRGAFNQFADVTFANGSGPNVKHFCIHDNQMLNPSLDLSSLYSLQDLYLWNNNQKWPINASTLPSTNLTDVEIYGNGFESVDFSGQSNLYWLDAQNNALTNVLLTNCSRLYEVNLTNNLLGSNALDNVLLALDTAGSRNGVLLFNGNPGTPSDTGWAGARSLQTKGWYVIPAPPAASLPLPSPIDAGGGWTLVQATNVNGGDSLPFTSTNTAGNLLICVVRDYNCTSGDIGISDSFTNTWLYSGAGLLTYASGGQDCNGTWGSGTGGLRVFYCINCRTGGDTVMVTHSGCYTSSGSVSMQVSEWSGVLQSSPVDVSASVTNQVTSSSLSAGSITTAYPNDMVFAFAANSQPSLSADSTGYTELSPGAYAYGQYRCQSIADTITPTISNTHGAGQAYGMISIAFRHQ